METQNQAIMKAKEAKGEIVLYQPDNTIRLEVRLKEESIWLTLSQIALLFGCSSDNVGLHLKNIYSEGELDYLSTTEEISVVRTEGLRKIRRKILHYNLDAILSVGYRVNSKHATAFRQWANRVLKDYMLRGYALNQRLDRLEQRVTITEHKIDFFVRSSLPPVEGVFCDGQIFDAFRFASDLIRSAKSRIILIDNYVDDSVLAMLDKRQKGVTAEIITKNVSKQFQLDLAKHNSQYSSITVSQNTRYHDRFLILDDNVYHLGVSLKDLGKKLFAFSKMSVPCSELI